MPTVQALINTVDATYRNSYSTTQKVEWMDTVQRQIYQMLPKEAVPYEFTTIENYAFYAIPDDCDRKGIKQFMIERSVGSNTFLTLQYLSLESTEEVSSVAQFYSVLDDDFFVNPMPTAETAGRKVFVVYNSRPASLSSGNLTAIPDLEEDFQELLVLGCLERIARARGEIDDKNNFSADYNKLFRDYERIYKLRQPEYYSTNDKMPRSRKGHWYASRRFGHGVASDLIPPGLM